MIFSLNPNYTIWIGLALVFGFFVWQFIIKPIMNQGQPTDPDQNQD